MKKLTPLLVIFALLLLAACGSNDSGEGATDLTNDSPHVPPTLSDAYDDEAMSDGDAEYLVQEVVVGQQGSNDADGQTPQATPVPQATPDPAPHAMFFEEHGVNPFIDTRDDNLSTFAIDVDTGSYTLMRSYLSDFNQLPPPESVRIEEYVNFFDYNYPTPETDAFAIHLEAAPAPYGESDAYQLLRVGIQGYEVVAEDRPDALLIFVIDVSGSMDQDNRLGLVKESLRLLVDALRPSDRVGIVVYGNNSRVVLTPTAVDDRVDIIQTIDGLRSEGATNVDAGIELAYEQANRFRLDGQMTRLIVLSDGVANVGNTTADLILENARREVSLSTFGFGMGNFNDALMEQLADKGDGTYAYVDTLREAQRLFVTDLTSTLVTIAKDAKIQVEFNSDVVETYRLLGYENRDVADQDFRNDDVDAGEIGAGHSVTALYEIRLAEGADIDEALTVRVRYEVPETGAVREIERSLRSADFATSFTSASASFQLAATVAEYAELLKGSFWARDNSLRTLVEDVERIGRLTENDTHVREWLDLVDIAIRFSP